MHNLKLTWMKYRWFLFIWIIINFIQALTTNLHYDEAYYWLYSQKLDWGYFDHPPMVGLLARIGDIIHHSTLGVRLFPIVMGSFVLFSIFHLIGDRKNYKEIIFFTISFPLVSSHIAGIFILPDAPLVFFFIIYLFSYRKYLHEDNIKNLFILSLAITAMIYSKYHAVLIIIFTILSNTSLLRRRSFWLSGIISFALLLPHILWQYNNNFPSLLYHLSDRAKGFEIFNFIHHIYSQILLAGPFSGVLIIWLAFKFQPKDQFHKTLKYITFGFYIFFLIYCFRGRVEAHWTSVSTIALIIISYKELHNHKKIRRIISYLLAPSILLIFIARIILATDYLDDKISFKSDFINMNKWAVELDSIAEGYPILFTNKYQDLSIYSFAKNKWTPGAPDYHSRYSQIDINRLDSIYNGNKVFALNLRDEKKWTSKDGSKHRGSFINDYYSYTGLKIDSIKLVHSNDSILLCFKLTNHTSKSFLMKKDEYQKITLVLSVDNNRIQYYDLHNLTKSDEIKAYAEIPFNIYLNNQIETKSPLINIGLASNNQRIFRARKKRYHIYD